LAVEVSHQRAQHVLATDAGGLPMTKRLSVEAVWHRVADALWLAARVLLVAAIAGGVYVAVQAFGFNKDAATWCGIIAVLVMAAAFPLLGMLMLWAVLAGGILAIVFAVMAIITTPPSLYSLVVVGLFLLAGILWQLTKLANKT
jgi:hypothetical protein